MSCHTTVKTPNSSSTNAAISGIVSGSQTTAASSGCTKPTEPLCQSRKFPTVTVEVTSATKVTVRGWLLIAFRKDTNTQSWTRRGITGRGRPPVVGPKLGGRGTHLDRGLRWGRRLLAGTRFSAAEGFKLSNHQLDAVRHLNVLMECSLNFLDS